MIRAALVLGLMLTASASGAQSTAATALALVQDGRYAAARQTLERAPHAPVDVLFLEAQILLHQGRRAEAATVLRAILASRPGLVPVRQLLARALADAQDFDAARFHYRALMAAEPNPATRARYARSLRAIDRAEPRGLEVSFAIVPSSNVNRGTYNAIIDTGLGAFAIDPTSRQAAALGVQIGGGAFVRWPTGAGGQAMARAAVTGTFYDNSAFNVVQSAAQLGWTRTGPAEEFSATGTISRFSRADGNDSTSATLVGRWARRSGEAARTVLTGAVRVVDYDATDALDGPAFQLDLGREVNPQPATQVSWGLRVGRGLPQADHLKYYSAALYAGVARTLPSGWAGFAGVEVVGRRYDANFTGLSFRREDTGLAVRASLLNSAVQIGGFAPRLTCSYEINASNVAFYDTTVTECALQMTRQF